MVDLPDSATPRLRQAAKLAQEQADRDGTPVRPEHLLFGMLDEGTGATVQVLGRLGIDLGSLRAALIGLPAAAPGPDQTAQQVIEGAGAEAEARGHHYLGQEHLLLGFFRAPQGAVARALATAGATYDRLVAEFTAIFAGP